VAAVRCERQLALMGCSLHDLKGRHELAALVVERMPSGFDAANHPVFVVCSKCVQYFSKFEAPFLLRLDGDLYLHSCPPWIAKESSNRRRTPTPECSPYAIPSRLSICTSRLLNRKVRRRPKSKLTILVHARLSWKWCYLASARLEGFRISRNHADGS
jgi:hypothetical protein